LLGAGTIRTWGGAFLALLLLCGGVSRAAEATVIATDPNDFAPFLPLFRPTGKFDETGLSGFEFLISSRTGQFRAADQYLIAGNVTAPTTSLAADLGQVADLSAVTFGFSVRHNLVGGRNFSFSLTNLVTSQVSVLCWGQNCPAGSLAAPILNGIPPISDYNGLQIQVRAQGVVGSSAAVTVTALNGVTVGGAPFFDEVVTPSSPGTVPFDLGRRGQLLLGDNLDLVVNEWELTGLVTLTRPDAALVDLTKVRLAVDLVRDPGLPFLVPEPSLLLLLAAAGTFLANLRCRGQALDNASSQGTSPL